MAKPNENRMLSLLEIAAQIGSSGLAELGGGLAYTPAFLAGGDKAGQHVKRAVEDAFTYQPRTEAARSILGMVGNKVAPVVDYGQSQVNRAADAAYGMTNSPAVGAAVKTMPRLFEELIDRVNIGKAMPDRFDMTAYHGSGKRFDRFDQSMTGQGTGNAAYGKGLYFSGDKSVASDYAKKLGGDSGVLYQVDIPDDAVARFLDWDTPVKGTPLNDLLDSVGWGARSSSTTGKDIYWRIADELGSEQAASEFLKSAGIPGIRYLDAGSRGAGGTSNFVVFDDSLIKILGKE